MISSIDNLVCLESLSLSDVVLSGKRASTHITVKTIKGVKSTFDLHLVYHNIIQPEHVPLIRLAFCMPLLNYGLFTKHIILHFPVSAADLSLLQDFNTIFSRDIFVNKIIQRSNVYILPKYLPSNEQIQSGDAEPRAQLLPDEMRSDQPLNKSNMLDTNSCGILSSGGKDSLVTYGLLKEIGATVYPLYVAESGGHWRTALPAYRFHEENDVHTQRVWTNVDRFYQFMLDRLSFIRPNHRRIPADTYPIRLCIFPYYIFSLLPLFIDNNIGNLLMGNEFDDIRYEVRHHGVSHYYGIYDQHQDFDNRMNAWYSSRIPGLYQWSALRNISGLIDERILIHRYPLLAQQQRSCHSCHFENHTIVPCGKCSKCLGVMLFILANKADPHIMQYDDSDIEYFFNHIGSSTLKLDKDEKEHSFYLLEKKQGGVEVGCIDHVERIHIHESTCDLASIPTHFRKPLLTVFEQYTKGFCKLYNDAWIPIDGTDIDI